MMSRIWNPFNGGSDGGTGAGVAKLWTKMFFFLSDIFQLRRDSQLLERQSGLYDE